MSSDWKRMKIGDLCDQFGAELQTGPFGSQLHSYDYKETGIPVVPTEAIDDGKINPDVLPKISSEKANELSRHLLRQGDILFARRGAQATGKTAMVRKSDEGAICGTGAIRLRIEKAKSIAFPSFLATYLSGKETICWIRHHAIGATMPNLNEGIIRSIPILLPSLREQKAIAHILGTLDEKIELNRKTNETLEAIAKALFKSWFVDFDPVRAKAEGRPTGLPAEISDLFPDSFEDSELGEIPSGWKITNLGTLIKQCGEPIQSSPTTRELPYVPIDCISSKSLSLREYKSGAEANTSLLLFREGDLLFGAMRPYFHKVCIAPFDGTTRTTCFALRPFADLHYSFVAMLLSAASTIEYATLHSTGSTIPYIRWSNGLENMLLIQPPHPILACFNNTALPLLQKISISLFTENPIAAFRDALLPKLISGELRIPDAEKMLEEVGI